MSMRSRWPPKTWPGRSWLRRWSWPPTRLCPSHRQAGLAQPPRPPAATRSTRHRAGRPAGCRCRWPGTRLRRRSGRRVGLAARRHQPQRWPAAVAARHPHQTARPPDLGTVPGRSFELVVALANHVRATVVDTGVPEWASQRRTTVPSHVVAEVQVWRAATQVNPDDRRPTGPTQPQKVARSWQHHLDRLVAGEPAPAQQEWGLLWRPAPTSPRTRSPRCSPIGWRRSLTPVSTCRSCSAPPARGAAAR